MISVNLFPGESVEQALRRLNREVLKNGLLESLRERQYFVPRTMRKVLKKKAAKRKHTNGQ